MPRARKHTTILAKRFEKPGDAEAAIRELQAAVQLQPDFPEAQNSLGSFCNVPVNVDDAIASFQRVLQQQPDNPEAHNNLGLARLQLGDADHAIPEFQAALRLRPQDAGYQTNLGIAYLQKPIRFGSRAISGGSREFAA